MEELDEYGQEVQRVVRELPPLVMINAVLIFVGFVSFLLCSMRERLQSRPSDNYKVGPFVPLMAASREFRDSWRQRWTAKPPNYSEMFFFNNNESTEVKNFRPQKSVFTEQVRKTETEIGIDDYIQNCNQCRQVVGVEVQGRQTKVYHILKIFFRLRNQDSSRADDSAASQSKETRKQQSSKRKAVDVVSTKSTSQRPTTIVLQPTPDDPNRIDLVCNFCDLDTLSYSTRFHP